MKNINLKKKTECVSLGTDSQTADKNKFVNLACREERKLYLIRDIK